MKKIHSQINVNIYYEDTDFSGFVYHANYLKFFERGREHAFGQKNLLDFFGKKNLQFVVKSLKIDYLKPVKFAESLLIDSEALLTNSPRIKFQQRALSSWSGELVCQAEVEIVCIDSSGRPKRLENDFPLV
ncbi:MAG: YbgC/FadM family acyl-CoA thioesterase [Oligoflexales bacterium]|nr:YbgC/FadM family acyl-CoA thioesterase [Oligoflexales bacterium]